MLAGGLPTSRPDHAEAVAEMALALQEEAGRHLDPAGRPLALRIGIDSGAVVAGVIGTAKFSYDLWGDTVVAVQSTAALAPAIAQGALADGPRPVEPSTCGRR